MNTGLVERIENILTRPLDVMDAIEAWLSPNPNECRQSKRERELMFYYAIIKAINGCQEAECQQAHSASDLNDIVTAASIDSAMLEEARMIQRGILPIEDSIVKPSLETGDLVPMSDTGQRSVVVGRSRVWG